MRKKEIIFSIYWGVKYQQGAKNGIVGDSDNLFLMPNSVLLSALLLNTLLSYGLFVGMSSL